MRLRTMIIAAVLCLFASATSLLIFGIIIISGGDGVLGLLMILGAIVSVGAGFGVLRGFRPLISKAEEGPSSPHRLPKTDK